MPITGIVAGQSGVFKETPLPVGAQIPAGTVPQWSASDPSISLTPAADGTTVTVAVPSDTTLTTFELKVQNQDGSFPTTVEVPILPPPPPAQTGFQIDQVS